jgi:hypothetical protein
LIGIVVIAALVLVFSGKKGKGKANEFDEIDWSDQVN